MMGSDNRRILFLVEIFPAPEQASPDQRGHKMLHNSIRPGRRPRSQRQMSALEYWSDGIIKITSHSTIPPTSLLQLSNPRWRAIEYQSKFS
jgi:hypothetical protein